ncbi:MAG: hypothetical protein WBV94_21850 [Blastocatellia bacterium]
MKPVFFRLLTLLFLTLTLSSIARATSITVSSDTIAGWGHPDSAPRLRIFLNKPVVTSDSHVLQSGSPQSNVFYKSVTCSVAGGVLSIPSFAIDSLTDALVGSDAKYSAWFYTASGQQIQSYRGFEAFSVPPVTPTTHAALLQFNLTTVPFRDNLTYTRTQIDAKVASIAVGGIWGGITGTLSNQSDLQAALAARQPIDTDLTVIAALSPSNDDLLQRKAGAWINRTPAQFKTDLSLTKTDVGLSSVTNDAQLKIASNLSDLASVVTARSNLGLGNSALLNVGAVAGTVAAGDHNHTGVYEPLLGYTSANAAALNASALTSGTVPDARFPATLPVSSGINLTALNASSLGSGTVPDARFPSTLPAVSGVNLTSLNASNLGSGTVPLARISGITNTEIAAGAAIVDTKLAAISTAGKVSDSALSANIPLKNGTNTFSAVNTFSVGVVIGSASQKLTYDPAFNNPNIGSAPLFLEPTFSYTDASTFRSVGMMVKPQNFGLTTGGTAIFWTPYNAVLGTSSAPVPLGTKGQLGGFEANIDTAQAAADEAANETGHGFGTTIVTRGGAPVSAMDAILTINTTPVTVTGVKGINVAIVNNAATSIAYGTHMESAGSSPGTAAHKIVGNWEYGIDMSTAAISTATILFKNNAGMAWRNAANSATIPAITLNTSDNLEVFVNLINQIANPYFQVGSNAAGWLFQKVDSDNRLRFFKQGGGEFFSISATGGATVTTASAAAFQVGPNGGTNPAFLVDGSTASAVTGLKLVTKAAASGVELLATSSGSNESITLTPKGTGNLILSSGQLTVPAGTSSLPPLARGADVSQGIFMDGTGTKIVQGGNTLVTFSNGGGVTFHFAGQSIPQSAEISWGSDTSLRRDIANYIKPTDLSGNGGGFGLLAVSANPAAPTADTGLHWYMKNKKLVIQFNDAGTTRYFTIDLTQSGATPAWAQSTTGP